jgi:di/tricarboxylate transporter
VVSDALDATGVTAWAGQELIARAGESRTRVLVLVLLLVALFTALISVNGSVAALVPVVAVMAVLLGRSPSQLMMPLAFGAHAGSLLALTGSPVNVIVSESADDAGVGRFGFAVGGLGPYALLVGLVLLTFVLGQLISNMATALIVIPIGVSASADLAISAKPVLMAICVASAALFLTPVATPANLMVMEPSGYRFGDYWKLGLPLLLLFGVVAVLLVPVFWSF